jgi:hypothetical protein
LNSGGSTKLIGVIYGDWMLMTGGVQ